MSFFSGHTSLAFSMATAYSYLFARRHPDSPLVVPVWLGAHLLAGTTAVLRVEAGQHFWTDVLAGAAVGSAIGYLVPWLHTRRDDDIPLPGNLMVLPSFHPQGFGAVATWIF
jgi:undecaprenyl-diphosphatase